MELSALQDEASRLEALERQVQDLQRQIRDCYRENMVSIICFSGEWDRLFAALSIASGSLAMGMEVHLFFTFWASSCLRAIGRLDGSNKTMLQKMFGRMLPCGPGRTRLSKYHFGGLGKYLMRRIMKKQGVEDIDSLFDEVKELGAHLHLCDTTAELFGLQCQELVDGEINHCGVATFLSLAQKSKTVLFI